MHAFMHDAETRPLSFPLLVHGPPPPPAHRVGVTSEPDHSVMELTPQDKFIVLASDGVWEFISSKEAVDIIAQHESAEEACRQVGLGQGRARAPGMHARMHACKRQGADGAAPVCNTHPDHPGQSIHGYIGKPSHTHIGIGLPAVAHR